MDSLVSSLLTLPESIGIGLNSALTLNNLFYCFVGVSVGMVVGVLPGIGPLAAMSMLFPFTFYLDPTAALIMLAGIHYGTSYGGSTAAILLNVPGTPSSAVACIEGYPMARQGRAGVALLLTTVASFIAGSIGIMLMMLFSPMIVDIARGFSSAEYFSLMVLGLVGASSMTFGSTIKGMAMIVLGILLGVIGLDMYTGVARFDFGILEMASGISLVAFTAGVFGVAEVIGSARTMEQNRVRKVTMRSMVPTRDDIRRSWKPTLRGAAMGSFAGALPGTGATIASYMAYAVERRVTKEPSRFGKGAVEGLCAPEAANNAADQTAFIPTMTLGIPGSVTMAILLGVLIIHGIAPGPRLVVEQPEIFWGLVMSFWIGNLLLLLLNIPLIGLWIRVLAVPYHFLYPAIIVFVCFGVYGVNNSLFDIWVVAAFGAAGYIMRLLNLPAPLLILGFVLGPLMEEHFRRAVILSRGDLMTFFDRPVSAGIMVITGLLLLWSMVKPLRQARRRARGIAQVPASEG